LFLWISGDERGLKKVRDNGLEAESYTLGDEGGKGEAVWIKVESPGRTNDERQTCTLSPAFTNLFEGNLIK